MTSSGGSLPGRTKRRGSLPDSLQPKGKVLLSGVSSLQSQAGHHQKADSSLRCWWRGSVWASLPERTYKGKAGHNVKFTVLAWYWSNWSWQLRSEIRDNIPPPGLEPGSLGREPSILTSKNVADFTYSICVLSQRPQLFASMLTTQRGGNSGTESEDATRATVCCVCR